jgi:hypothetical protein
MRENHIYKQGNEDFQCSFSFCLGANDIGKKKGRKNSKEGLSDRHTKTGSLTNIKV